MTARFTMPVDPAGYFSATAASIGLDDGIAQILLAGQGSDNVHAHARALMNVAAERLALTPPAGSGWRN